MLRLGAVRPAFKAASLRGRSPTLGTALRQPPLLSSRLYAAYPKEGVFQPNSPPRNIPGFGPAPPSPHEPQPPLPRNQGPPGPPGGPSGYQTSRQWLPTFRWYKVLGALVVFGYGFYKMQTRLFLLIPIEPDSEEDAEELELLWEEFDQLPLVQQLRDSQKFVEGEGYKPAFREWTAYSGLKDDGRRSQRLTTGPLAGSAGVAAQKVFWNEDGPQLYLFVNFGAATQGWPQVVHGGAISTICDEALGRLAIRSLEAKTAVTATLEVQFLDRVHPGQWHVLVAMIDTDKLADCTDRKKYIKGVLACCGDDGPTKEGSNVNNLHAHAIAKGLFVVPKHTPLAALEEDF